MGSFPSMSFAIASVSLCVKASHNGYTGISIELMAAKAPLQKTVGKERKLV